MQCLWLPQLPTLSQSHPAHVLLSNTKRSSLTLPLAASIFGSTPTFDKEPEIKKTRMNTEFSTFMRFLLVRVTRLELAAS